MNINLEDSFKIKLEPKEIELNQFKVGIDERDESYYLSNYHQHKDKLNDQQLIKHLLQKLKIADNKLLVVTYQYKLKHAQAILIRDKQAKTIKRFKKENFKLKQKLNQVDELTGCLEKICSNYRNLNASESSKRNSSSSNLTKVNKI